MIRLYQTDHHFVASAKTDEGGEINVEHVTESKKLEGWSEF